MKQPIKLTGNDSDFACLKVGKTVEKVFGGIGNRQISMYSMGKLNGMFFQSVGRITP